MASFVRNSDEWNGSSTSINLLHYLATRTIAWIFMEGRVVSPLHQYTASTPHQLPGSAFHFTENPQRGGGTNAAIRDRRGIKWMPSKWEAEFFFSVASEQINRCPHTFSRHNVHYWPFRMSSGMVCPSGYYVFVGYLAPHICVRVVSRSVRSNMHHSLERSYYEHTWFCFYLLLPP